MKNLNYETIATEAHAVTVATWDTETGVGYKMTLDGKVLDTGVIGDDASPSEE